VKPKRRWATENIVFYLSAELSRLQVGCDWFFNFSDVRGMMTHTSGLVEF
jgi:hypothetical protein